MANQVIPRLNGDDYQHLFSWYNVLSLLRARDQVQRVRVEDQDAGSVDDVTVYYEPGSGHGEEFYHYFFQVKYHENQEQHYSTEKLLERKPNGRSLLQKFWDTWREVHSQHSGHRIELFLVSNWSWDISDKVARCISGQDDSLTDEFFECSATSDLGRLRERWRLHIGAEPGEFSDFARSLRLRLGYGCWRQLKSFVSERMEHLGLKCDENALAVAAGIVRDWIRTRKGDITIGVLERTLKDRELYAAEAGEQCVTVYLNTIKERMFELEPDYILDWRKYFVGRADSKGHELKDPTNWNKRLLPELRRIAGKIGTSTTCRLVRARGSARLSAWFAFGHTFSEVAGYTIEVQQQSEHWRTDATPTPDFRMIPCGDDFPGGQVIKASGTTVACGISVTGALDEDVRRHLASAEAERTAALLLIRPERELGSECLSCAGDAAALARESKEFIRPFVKRWAATRLLLYYFGPLGGACFIGHQLNAVCHEIQVMEDQQPGYASSFLLD